MLIQELIPVLQFAIGPAILISGASSLLLSMTNRLGRIVDRARQLAGHSRTVAEPDRARIRAQLIILNRRAHLMRTAIALDTISILLSAILIMLLFITALLHWETAIFVTLLFAGILLALIGALILLLRDVNLSLSALKLEMAAGE